MVDADKFSSCDGAWSPFFLFQTRLLHHSLFHLDPLLAWWPKFLKSHVAAVNNELKNQPRRGNTSYRYGCFKQDCITYKTVLLRGGTLLRASKQSTTIANQESILHWHWQLRPRPIIVFKIKSIMLIASNSFIWSWQKRYGKMRFQSQVCKWIKCKV